MAEDVAEVCAADPAAAGTGLDEADFVRTWEVTDASSRDGRMLRRGLLDASNTAATVWADSA